MLQTSVVIVNPGGTGRPRVGHLGEARAFAAEQVLHRAIAVGLAVAEEIHVFLALPAGAAFAAAAGFFAAGFFGAGFFAARFFDMYDSGRGVF